MRREQTKKIGACRTKMAALAIGFGIQTPGLCQGDPRLLIWEV